jgi:hypothetical protein
MEALSSTCTQYARRQTGPLHLASDVVVTFCLGLATGAVLMCQAILYAVAMNSERNALLGLLIAANFVEIKGTVYKRMDTNKLWSLACMVGVEPGM